MSAKNFVVVAIVLTVVFQVFASVDPCVYTTPLPVDGRTEVARNVSSNQGMGDIPGTDFHYELWFNDNSSPTVSMQLYPANQGGGAAFYASWANSGNQTANYLARTGYFWGNGQTYENYGNIYCDFSFNRTGTGGAWSYFGIYGWSRNPGAANPNDRLIEFYVVEDWFNDGQLTHWTVCPGQNCTSQGTITVDGGTYHIYTNYQINEPSIDGPRTFLQIFSVRQGKRQCGTVSVTEHFEEWERQLDITLGNLYEVKFKVEVGGGTGTFDAHYLTFSQEETPRGIPDGHFPVIVNISPSTGGSVSRNPTAIAYEPGTSVELTAMANAGWEFTGWSGGATGSTNPLTITTGNAAMNITAVFALSADGTNLVKNGDFSAGTGGMSDWTLNSWGDSEATTSTSNGSVSINIVTLPTTGHNYDLQLVQSGIPLLQGNKYRLSFEATAVAARTMQVMFQMPEDPWTTFYSVDNLTLTTATGTFIYEFTMEDADYANARLGFNIGNSDVNVTIGNVSVVLIDENTSIRSSSVAPSAAAQNRGLRVTAKRSAVNVRFNAQNSGATELRLYNLKGEVVARTTLRTVAGRNYSYNFSTRRIPNGVYVVAVHSGGSVMQSRVAVPK
ncbi:MAG: glycoside hydrolase family 11 protein [Chitinispirillales bacterium]|nr:glycoside hydrolase family 11 protein [Chitinispirillales bacterium]